MGSFSENLTYGVFDQNSTRIKKKLRSHKRQCNSRTKHFLYFIEKDRKHHHETVMCILFVAIMARPLVCSDWWLSRCSFCWVVMRLSKPFPEDMLMIWLINLWVGPGFGASVSSSSGKYGALGNVSRSQVCWSLALMISARPSTIFLQR